ncbi:MAG: FecR domain-containing protein [Myxococcales bacterium]|nr:FecR domain-containing protein [Myxococcales bacterium]
MSDAQEQRWLDIVDRETLGEPLSPEDLEFRREYEETHPECARERDVWAQMIGALVDAGEDDEDTATLELLTARALAGAREDGQGATSEPASVVSLAPRRRRQVWVTLAGVAAAAGIALTMWARPWVGDAPSPASPASPTPELAAREPSTPAPGERTLPVHSDIPAIVALTPRGADGLTPGEEAPEVLRAEGGDLCVRYLAPLASVCLGEGGEMRLGRGPSGDREVELRAGRLVAALDPLPEGERFVVQTPAGSVSVVGTVFIVELDPSGEASVSVLEGTVEVRGRERDAPVRVSAGLGMQFGAAAPAPVISDAPALEWGRARAALGALWRDASVARVTRPEVDEDAAGELVLDGVSLGAAPLDMVVSPGPHALEWRAADGEVSRESLELSPGVARSLAPRSRVAVAAAPEVSDVGSRSPERARRPSIDALKRRARSARAARSWAEAAESYEELIRRYPRTPAAQNARVQLGELLRDRLGQPERALASYDDYIARGGDLIVEAHHGRILALRQLGRAAEERGAIERFLEQFPGSLVAGGLRARLDELRAAEKR